MDSRPGCRLLLAPLVSSGMVCTTTSKLVFTNGRIIIGEENISSQCVHPGSREPLKKAPGGWEDIHLSSRLHQGEFSRSIMTGLQKMLMIAPVSGFYYQNENVKGIDHNIG